MRSLLALTLISATPAFAEESHAVPSDHPTADPFAWLEDVRAAKSLDWVRARNAETLKELTGPGFDKTRAEVLEILDSPEKIPDLQRVGPLYYNFWKDQTHVRGLWRRTSLDEYRKATPAWETVLDLDALAAKEKENWVWQAADCLEPDYRRCLVFLSRGGTDANVVRELDLTTKAFVPDGFTLSEAKSGVNWRTLDEVYVGTDFGPGSMTTSGYPRLVKLWKRGTPLSAATLVYEGQPGDVSVSAYRTHTPGFERDLVTRDTSFFSTERFLRRADGSLAHIDVPSDSLMSTFREWMLVQTRTPWTVDGKTYPAGALLAARFDDFVAGKRQLTVLFTATPTRSLDSHSWTRHHLVLNELEDVSSRVEILTPPAEAGGTWSRRPFGDVPALSTVAVSGTDADQDDEVFVNSEGFLTPETFSRSDATSGKSETLKQGPAFFDARGLEVRQYFVASKDGTRIPYFVMARKDVALDGMNPTLLYGYGGFEVSLTPAYNAPAGRDWLSKGGVYVIANIRGGGEYGSAWHLAALKQNRLKAYEDFAAVARDLVARKVTSAKHLAAVGGSNGGLLVGNMLTLYPELFGAVVCQVPLLDMQRYTKLSAGASWIAEYGDPDKPEEWAFIQKFSPYFNARAGVKYPPVLFLTSTADDRVGPVQARKMAAKLLSFGNDVHFYENIEGGHAGAANNQETAFMKALTYTYLWKRLK